MAAPGRSLGMTVAGYFLASSAIACIAVGGKIAIDHIRVIRSWPAVTATVISSAAAFVTKDKKNKRFYVARIEVRYSVNGNLYTTKVNYGEGSYPLHDAERHVGTYAPGSVTTVRVNPDNPTEVRLDVGYNTTFFSFPLVAALCALTLGGLALACLTSKSPPPDLR